MLVAMPGMKSDDRCPNLSRICVCSDGDGGGGLFCEHNQIWYQIGIISFGIGCGRQDSPGVYTNVISYLNWIFDTTSKF